MLIEEKLSMIIFHHSLSSSPSLLIHVSLKIQAVFLINLLICQAEHNSALTPPFQKLHVLFMVIDFHSECDPNSCIIFANDQWITSTQYDVFCRVHYRFFPCSYTPAGM